MNPADSTMWKKLRIRASSKRTVYGLCLVTTTFFCVIFILLQDNNNDNIVRKSQSDDNVVQRAHPIIISSAWDEEYYPENNNDIAESTTPAQRYPPVSHDRAVNIRINVNIKAPGTRPWNHSWSEMDREGLFAMSPYNWANKKGIAAMKTYTPSTKPLLIAWQASETLLLRVQSSTMFENCSVSHCRVSPSNKVIRQASAIVYDDDRIESQTPPDLKEDRVLVYYSMRTPNDIVTDKSKEEVFDEDWKAVFNWVWSYRQDSDIFEPFGYIKKVNILTEVGRPQSFAGLLKAKTQVAVWINPHVSRDKYDSSEEGRNLHRGKSHTGVEPYLKAFRKVAPLDAMDIDELKAAIQPAYGSFSVNKYFFILAFEWVDCVDYVSDLFFDVFDPKILAVPVVRGRFDYSRYFPKGTFVNADDFQSAGDLAAYLTDLASRKKVYAQMLWRKMQYVRENALPYAWCQLCEMVHRAREDKRLSKRIDDIHAWFQKGGGCQVTNKTEINIRKAAMKEIKKEKITQAAYKVGSSEVPHAAGVTGGRITTEGGLDQKVGNRIEEDVTVKEEDRVQETERAVADDDTAGKVLAETEKGLSQETVERVEEDVSAEDDDTVQETEDTVAGDDPAGKLVAETENGLSQETVEKVEEDVTVEEDDRVQEMEDTVTESKITTKRVTVTRGSAVHENGEFIIREAAEKDE